MNSVLRALLTLVGALLIVGATIIFLRQLGTVLAPGVSSALVFLVGVGLLWLAFRPDNIEVRDEGADSSGMPDTVETPYGRGALARLQEAFDSESTPPDRPVGQLGRLS